MKHGGEYLTSTLLRRNMEQGILLVDHACHGGFIALDIHESTGGTVKFRGKLQEAEAKNKNGRIYPFRVLDDNIERLKEAVQERRLVGELDHPTDSIVHFANASHVITKMWWDGNKLMGEGEILNTPSGLVLRRLLEANVPIGMSSRGVGNGKVDENGILVIGESYKLITFDAVADPSTFSAFQERVVGGRRNESVLSSPAVINNSKTTYTNAVKNETTRIDTVSKDALIACLGGIVKSQVEHYKARIK